MLRARPTRPHHEHEPGSHCRNLGAVRCCVVDATRRDAGAPSPGSTRASLAVVVRATRSVREFGRVGHDGGMTPANPAVGHVPEAPTLPTSGDDGGRGLRRRRPLPRAGGASRRAGGGAAARREAAPGVLLDRQPRRSSARTTTSSTTTGPPPSFTFGDSQGRVDLPSGQSYSSFVLLPLLTFAARRRCLFVGGPGPRQDRQRDPAWACSPATRCATCAAPCSTASRR